MNFSVPLRRLNTFLAKHVSLIIISGIVLGLMTDIFSRISNTTLSFVLFLELFIAGFSVKVEDVRSIEVKSALLFVILRYFVLAIVLYFLGSLYSPHVGVTLLIMTLLPTGVSSPGFAGLFRANVALVISFVIVTSLLSPFYLPFVIEKVAGSVVSINSSDMLSTILLIVVVPTVIHIPLRRVNSFNNFMIEFNPLLLIPLVWITILVPISRYRVELLDNLLYSTFVIGAFLLLYFFYMGFGLLFCAGKDSESRKSFIISSCIHNITLGVVLAFLYFPGRVAALMVLANISAIITISFLKYLLNRVSRSAVLVRS